MTKKTIDIKTAMLSPTKIFKSPHEVLNHSDLTKEQKIEILERWKYDAQILETADDENMPATSNHMGILSMDILDEILEDLNKLKD